MLGMVARAVRLAQVKKKNCVQNQQLQVKLMLDKPSNVSIERIEQR